MPSVSVLFPCLLLSWVCTCIVGVCLHILPTFSTQILNIFRLGPSAYVNIETDYLIARHNGKLFDVPIFSKVFEPSSLAFAADFLSFIGAFSAVHFLQIDKQILVNKSTRL